MHVIIPKLKRLLVSMLSILLLLVNFAPAAVLAQADVQGSVCSGGNSLQITTSGGDCSKVCPQTKTGSTCGDKANSLIATIINLLSVIIGVVAVIMIMVGGFRYVTSGGSQEAVGKAKTTILYAVVGLVIVALAQIIVQFVLHKTRQATG
jgi:hypothetical protein